MWLSWNEQQLTCKQSQGYVCSPTFKCLPTYTNASKRICWVLVKTVWSSRSWKKLKKLRFYTFFYDWIYEENVPQPITQLTLSFQEIYLTRVAWSFDIFEHNLGIDHKFTKYLKENCTLDYEHLSPSNIFWKFHLLQRYHQNSQAGFGHYRHRLAKEVHKQPIMKFLQGK